MYDKETGKFWDYEKKEWMDDKPDNQRCDNCHWGQVKKDETRRWCPKHRHGTMPNEGWCKHWIPIQVYPKPKKGGE